MHRVGSQCIPKQSRHRSTRAGRAVNAVFFWLIWLINQRAAYNHALSVVHRRRRHLRCMCAALLATALDIETSY